MTITISAKTPQFIRQEGAAIVAQPGTTVDCDDWRARWLIKNGLYVPYYTYCYMMGYTDVIEINRSELAEIKDKMEKQEKLLIELNQKFKIQETKL